MAENPYEPPRMLEKRLGVVRSIANCHTVFICGLTLIAGSLGMFSLLFWMPYLPDPNSRYLDLFNVAAWMFTAGIFATVLGGIGCAARRRDRSTS